MAPLPSMTPVPPSPAGDGIGRASAQRKQFSLTNFFYDINCRYTPVTLSLRHGFGLLETMGMARADRKLCLNDGQNFRGARVRVRTGHWGEPAGVAKRARQRSPC